MNVNYRGENFVISTQYQNRGDELIVFIHGGGCAKESFQEAFKAVELLPYSLLTFDLLGHGRSSRPQYFSYAMEDHAEFIYALIQQFNYTKIHIVAHSMGGAIGLLLAQKLNHKLASFINVEGNLIGDDCNTSRVVSRMSYEEFKNSGFQKIKDKCRKSPDKIIQLWAEWLELADVYGIFNSFISLVKWSDSGKLLDKFLELKCKKVYLYGEKNSAKKADLLNQLIGIQVKSISNGTHFVMLDNPDEFNRTIAQTIKKIAI